MITIKTLEEIELMRESALIVSKTLGMLAAEVTLNKIFLNRKLKIITMVVDGLFF